MLVINVCLFTRGKQIKFWAQLVSKFLESQLRVRVNQYIKFSNMGSAAYLLDTIPPRWKVGPTRICPHKQFSYAMWRATVKKHKVMHGVWRTLKKDLSHLWNWSRGHTTKTSSLLVSVVLLYNGDLYTSTKKERLRAQ